MPDRVKLTERRLTCLRWYADKENVPSPEGRMHDGDEYPFTGREMNWALEHDLLCVGPNGWHVPSNSGRALLASNAKTDSDNSLTDPSTMGGERE